APIARHQRSSTQLTSLLINNAGALRPVAGWKWQESGSESQNDACKVAAEGMAAPVGVGWNSGPKMTMRLCRFVGRGEALPPRCNDAPARVNPVVALQI
ncbi:hypothetical protein OSI29_24920, partial [Mycobacterium ulcerans]|nr:hypothetical protein [Mycobacterium ulcerans]MEB4029283.1 hypothetical protein [Mycobacterium ulcerans]MEB4136837.1 hypothetical protein [Mycobacterium ulcerans]MEB4228738.1 hypothetical protein [Mycobacterium ulcerans]MEB4249415.1 hypothetical protein [Mycobacterium ulcerans]